MGFKTITIKDNVYEKIARAKNKGESFSELFDRKFSEETIEERTARIMKHAGTWSKMSDEEFAKVKERMRKYREGFNKNAEERKKRLWR